MDTAVLEQRNPQPELMDQPDLDPERHRHALRGLRRINALSGSAGILWPAIADYVRTRKPNRVRVLDVACGGGDVAVALARRARRQKLDVGVTGCDISPVAVEAARRLAPDGAVPFFRLDVLREPLPNGYDVIACSLFLHHLSDGDALELLRNMAEAAEGMVLVSDLRRTRTGYGLAWAGCRLLSRSPVVHVDGPRSVAAAFTPDELMALAARAGLAGAQVTRHWPQRMLLTWRRT
jgi:2-polyprenyl-3-methyl-5-hydroxy-6-metoxy-1,4-benzoquinol methylase